MLHQSFSDVPAFPDIDHIMIPVVEIIDARGIGRDVFEVERVQEIRHWGRGRGAIIFTKVNHIADSPQTASKNGIVNGFNSFEMQMKINATF